MLHYGYHSPEAHIHHAVTLVAMETAKKEWFHCYEDSSCLLYNVPHAFTD